MPTRHQHDSHATLTQPEISACLAAQLPHWRLEDGFIVRKYTTSGWRATLMVVNTVGHLAEAAFHHPDLVVSYGHVIVRLMTHDAGAITAKDLALALKIEEVVMWQPGRDGSHPLSGPPDDPQFRYIEYD